MNTDRSKKSIVVCFFVTLLLLIILAPIFSVSALEWIYWSNASVGDVPEHSLPNCWTIESTPKAGYESYLWSSWNLVTYSSIDRNSNGDKEIEFYTYSDTSLMGYISFTSVASFTGISQIGLKINGACKWSYSRAENLGYVEIWDATTDSAAYSFVFQSGTTPDTYRWSSYIYDEYDEFLSLNPSHTYEIILRAKDAWLGQRVAVLWEYVKILLAPTSDSFTHYYHDIWYEDCVWRASATWSNDGLNDLQRDRRPYGGLPYGWNPATVFEFRSYPYHRLEGDSWWSTNFPGSVGLHDSSEAEEQSDGYEEVEAWTYNPELFQANTNYYWRFGYIVNYPPLSAYVVFELELVNEADLLGWLSPPGYPADYYNLDEKTVYHGYAPIVPKINQFQSQNPSAIESKANQEISRQRLLYNESFPNLNIRVVGQTPDYLDVWAILDIESNTELQEFLGERKNTFFHTLQENILSDDELVYATITFNKLLNEEEYLKFVSSSGLEVESFRYKALENGEFIRGQATLAEDETFPRSKLQQFLTPAEFQGIYRTDGFIPRDRILEAQYHPQVLLVDFSGFLILKNSNLDAKEIRYYIDDPFWLLERFSAK